MTLAARPFGRRPREDQGAAKPAASLGAVLELLRALNWTIRADVPWPTERGRAFDFVLIGEPGVFAMWVHEGEPDGVEEAAAALGELLEVTGIRPVVCRAAASLTEAHPQVLYCTPETALDLLVGLPAHENIAAIRESAARLRDLEVPIPPEPEPEPEKPVPVPEPAPPPVVVAPESAPKPAPAKVIVPATPAAPEPSQVARKVAPPKVAVPQPVQVEPVKVEPVKVEAAKPPVKVEPAKIATSRRQPVAPVAKPERQPQPQAQAQPVPVVAPPVSAPAVAEPELTSTTPPEPVVSSPAPEAAALQSQPAADASRSLPAGRHRSERPRRVLAPMRRTPPPPPAESAGIEHSGATIDMPTALVAPRGRARGDNAAAQRFDNSYVFVPAPVEGPGPLRREFRAKPFLTGIAVLIGLVLVAGIGVKAWPQLAGLVKSQAHVSAPFGQPINVDTSNFHPKLSMTVTLPQRTGAARGTVSYAVDLSVSDLGTTAWALPARSAFVMVDSLGESHALAGIAGVASSRWAGALKPAQSWSGRLVFTMRAGRTPLRLRFALAANGSESATWR